MLWDALFSEPSKESLILTTTISDIDALFKKTQKSLLEVGDGITKEKSSKLKQHGKPSVLDIFRDNLNINLPGDLLRNNWIEINIDHPRLLELIKVHHLEDIMGKALKVKPHQRLVLLSTCGRAVLIWGVSQVSGFDPGVQCMIFRNDSTNLSSKLITDAEKLANDKWPQYSCFTIINTSEIKSTNPGYCFKCAGWEFTKKLRGPYHLLVKKPSDIDQIIVI